MARGRKNPNGQKVGDYRHKQAKRKNNPPAGIAPTYEVRERETRKYEFDPHLDPQLVWAGKAEHTSFDVDVVPLHIHERISTRAILEAVKRPEPQMALFGNQELPMDKQIEFYRHEIGWANRLILGDSLLVMNSMLVKEGMAGKVQCIYIDPPYGIDYKANFQSAANKPNVANKDDDLTREPEQIRAYRDAWKLGTHSYLTYLRDRLLLARALLHKSGSVFIQINDENLHLVQSLLDECYGRENHVATIPFRKKTMPLGAKHLERMYDYILWYANDLPELKFHHLYEEQDVEGEFHWCWFETPDGYRHRMSDAQNKDHDLLPSDSRIYRLVSMWPASFSDAAVFPVEYEGIQHLPADGQCWPTGPDAMRRITSTERVQEEGDFLRRIVYLDEYGYTKLTSIWTDTIGARDPVYAVQTADAVVERCILMTTDPGDLVFDPTCGGGTTACCAERWGRRWVTCDTSRVALLIARQRLMTAKYDYHELQDAERGPAAGFKYETVPHITLESIAKNPEIDAIAAKYQPEIDSTLKDLNKALGAARVKEILPPRRTRRQNDKSGRSADSGKRSAFEEWEVPREADKTWSKEAKEAHRQFWDAKRAKRKEIDVSIQRNAPQETLYDKPFKRSGVVRVSGPFTVEAIPAPAITEPSQATPIPQFEAQEAQGRVNDRAGDYLTDMINLLKQQGGVLFPGGKKLELLNLRPLNVGLLHAEAEAPSPQPSPASGRGRNGVPSPLKGEGKGEGGSRRVAISFGPQYGPVSAYQVNEAIQTAKMNAYDVLVLAGFSFEAEAHSFIQKARETVKGLQVHLANVAPDVLVGDLLKTSRASQIFTAYGQPDISKPEKQKDGTFVVELRGVDVYDPLTGEVNSTRGEDVAAWFLDTDYDGMTFHICQAFFPGDKDAWDKLQRALRAQIEPEAFEQMRGTRSFPFKPGKHNRIAVKVLDFRGNEVMRTRELGSR